MNFFKLNITKTYSFLCLSICALISFYAQESYSIDQNYSENSEYTDYFGEYNQDENTCTSDASQISEPSELDEFEDFMGEFDNFNLTKMCEENPEMCKKPEAPTWLELQKRRMLSMVARVPGALWVALKLYGYMYPQENIQNAEEEIDDHIARSSSFEQDDFISLAPSNTTSNLHNSREL